jgi:hypothetical protein
MAYRLPRTVAVAARDSTPSFDDWARSLPVELLQRPSSGLGGFGAARKRETVTKGPAPSSMIQTKFRTMRLPASSGDAEPKKDGGQVHTARTPAATYSSYAAESIRTGSSRSPV